MPIISVLSASFTFLGPFNSYHLEFYGASEKDLQPASVFNKIGNRYLQLGFISARDESESLGPEGVERGRKHHPSSHMGIP